MLTKNNIWQCSNVRVCQLQRNIQFRKKGKIPVSRIDQVKYIQKNVVETVKFIKYVHLLWKQKVFIIKATKLFKNPEI